MAFHRFAGPDDVVRGTEKCYIRKAINLLKTNGGYDFSVADELGRLCPNGGLVVGSNEEGAVQIATGDSHSLIVGCSGRGKTRRVIIPTVETLILACRNIVVNDMKGEVLESVKSLLELMDYDIFVLDFRNPQCSPHMYNPLSSAWHAWNEENRDAAARLLRSFAFTVFSNSAESGAKVDPFWEASSQEYFIGLALGMLEAGCCEEEFTLESIAAMDRTQANYSRGKTPLDKFFARLNGTLAANAAAGTLGAPSDTKASILSVWRQEMSIYCSQDGLMRLLSYSNFDASVLFGEKTAIFLISPDERAELAPIVTAIFGQLMSETIALAERCGGTLKLPVDFVLDEFGNLARRISNMGGIVSACRSRGIKLHFCVQSDAQLEHVYGSDLKEVILGNIYTQIFLGTRDYNFLKRFSEQLGEYTTLSGKSERRLTPGQLQRLEKRGDETEAVVLIDDLEPFVATLPDFETLCPLSRRMRGNGLVTSLRHTGERRPVFDVVRLVKGWEEEEFKAKLDGLADLASGS